MQGETLFNRQYELAITPIDGKPFIVKDLNIAFEIKRVLRADPDPGMIDIYNLGEEARKAIAKPYDPDKKPGAKVQLKVGYEGAIPLIYTGEVLEGKPKLENATWLMNLRCGCDYYKWIKELHSKAFAPGTDPLDAVKSLLASAGKTTSIAAKLTDMIKKKFVNGKSVSANLKDIMREFGQETGIVATATAEGPVQLTEFGYPNNDKPVMISESTGLVGTPEITHKGVNFKCLMQPRIRPGTPIILDSRTTESYGRYFTSEVVTHNGEYRGDAWHTTVESLFFPPRFLNQTAA